MEVKPYICSAQNCDKSYGKFILLKRHLLQHEGRGFYQCPHLNCEKNFSEKSYLKIHLRVHTKEKPIKCKYCSRHFAARSNLCIHQKRHLITK